LGLLAVSAKTLHLRRLSLYLLDAQKEFLAPYGASHQWVRAGHAGQSRVPPETSQRRPTVYNADLILSARYAYTEVILCRSPPSRKCASTESGSCSLLEPRFWPTFRRAAPFDSGSSYRGATSPPQSWSVKEALGDKKTRLIGSAMDPSRRNPSATMSLRSSVPECVPGPLIIPPSQPAAIREVIGSQLVVAGASGCSRGSGPNEPSLLAAPTVGCAASDILAPDGFCNSRWCPARDIARQATLRHRTTRRLDRHRPHCTDRSAIAADKRKERIPTTPV